MPDFPCLWFFPSKSAMEKAYNKFKAVFTK